MISKNCRHTPTYPSTEGYVVIHSDNGPHSQEKERATKTLSLNLTFMMLHKRIQQGCIYVKYKSRWNSSTMLNVRKSGYGEGGKQPERHTQGFHTAGKSLSLPWYWYMCAWLVKVQDCSLLMCTYFLHMQWTLIKFFCVCKGVFFKIS